MNTTVKDLWLRMTMRACFAAVVLVLFVAVGVGASNAAEIIPSIGVTRALHDDDADAEMYGGLAVRGHLVPFLKTEIGVAYRSESRLDDALKVRMWPVTASLWLTPIPMLYAGGGVGWYHTTFDFDETLPISDETSQEFGVHAGGGVVVPLAPAVSLDLNGRYVFLEKDEGGLPPEEFDPDFWSTTLGLAIQF
jgi:hypothetical protein